MATITVQKVTVSGDAVTVVGTVDGQLTSIQVWKSHLDTLSTNAQKITYIAQQLKQSLLTSSDVATLENQTVVI